MRHGNGIVSPELTAQSCEQRRSIKIMTMRITTPIVTLVLITATSASAATNEANLRPAVAGMSDCQVIASAVQADTDGPMAVPKLLSRSLAVSWIDIPTRLSSFDLLADERDDLIRNARHHDFGDFQPECGREFKRIRFMHHGENLTSSFSRPLYSTDGSIAILGWHRVNMSQLEAMSGLCLARRTEGVWKSECIDLVEEAVRQKTQK